MLWLQLWFDFGSTAFDCMFTCSVSLSEVAASGDRIHNYFFRPQGGSPYTARHTAVASSDSSSVERQSNESWTAVGLQSRWVESWLKLQPQQLPAIVCNFNTFLLKCLQSFKLRKFQYVIVLLWTVHCCVITTVFRPIGYNYIFLTWYFRSIFIMFCALSFIVSHVAFQSLSVCLAIMTADAMCWVGTPKKQIAIAGQQQLGE